METLEIHNFLTIKEAKLEVHPFTVLIGPQASGKSLIAKLLFYFRNLLNSHFIKSISRNGSIDKLKDESINSFFQIFSKDALSGKRFNIVYHINGFQLSLTCNGKDVISLDISDKLIDLRNETIIHINKQKEDAENQNISIVMNIKRFIYDNLSTTFIYRSIYIPTGRSFFANLQNNIFTFLFNDVNIDFFLKQFGSTLERNKDIYMSLRTSSRKTNVLNSKRDSIFKRIDNIIGGTYLYENEQDWIICDDNKCNLIYASSGQQEVLPLLIILSVSPTRIKWLGETGYICEEPESSLFPTTQKKLIELFLLLQNEFKHEYLLTTHSPYILVAINNAIMASNVIEEKGEIVKKAVSNVIDENLWIKYEDVMAYTIEDGVLKSIMDEESRLIGINIIDSVSDEFNHVFDQLIHISLEQ